MKREPGARMNVLRAPYALGERSLDKYLIVRRILDRNGQVALWIFAAVSGMQLSA